MDSKNVTTGYGGGGGGGIKVTYIETQFVTSDEAGFKDLVQRLTGKSAPPPAPHRPSPCRPDHGHRRRGTPAAGAAVPQGAYQYPVAEAEVRPAAIIGATPTYLHQDMGLQDFIEMGDFSDLFYVGVSDRSDGCCYGSFPYFNRV